MVQLLDSLQIMRFSAIYIKLIVLIPVLFTSTNTSRKPQIYYVLYDIVYYLIPKWYGWGHIYSMCFKKQQKFSQEYLSSTSHSF